MCGILGQVELTAPVSNDRERMARTLEALRHRGPDDSGMHFGEGFCFGHRRLSILDLSAAGHQPMASLDRAVTLVFNGEIYNYAELKGDLEDRGYVFRSSCDTEVLLNGIHCHGIAFIERCNGMFALAAHDARTRTAWLVRDRLGIKPLYYALLHGRLTFSSEVKGILGLEDVERRINLAAVSSYLSFRYPVLDDTFFEGIAALPPGHYLEIRGGGHRLKAYWDPAGKYAEQAEDRGEAYYIEALRERMASSIRYRLIADVPVGAILSGGVDSSIITALVARERAGIHTYTIGYAQEGYNEFEYAAMIAGRYGACHHEVRSDPGTYVRHMEDLIGFKDAPLSIPNEATQYELMRRLSQDVTVVLAGTGADEIFYGYGRIYRSVDDYRRACGPNSDGPAHPEFLARFRQKYGCDGFDSELDHFLHVYAYTSVEQKRRLLNPDLDLDGCENRLRERVAGLFGAVETGSYLDRMGYAFVRLHLPGILLHNDVTSMADSVELRVPFLDHRVVELAMSIPAGHKLRWKSPEAARQAESLTSEAISETYDTPKYILRKAFEELIPGPILQRRKVGFPVPLHDWMGGGLREYVRSVLLDPRALGRGIYHARNLEDWLSGKDVARHSGDERTYQFSLAGKIWMLLNLELFFRRYFD